MEVEKPVSVEQVQEQEEEMVEGTREATGSSTEEMKTQEAEKQNGQEKDANLEKPLPFDKKNLGYPKVFYVNHAKIESIKRKLAEEEDVSEDRLDRVRREISISLRSNTFPGLGMSDEWESVQKATFKHLSSLEY
eukprot:Nk52_evm1s27 gene=Nk52_evmTU1s27